MGSMLREKPFRATNGYLALVITVILFGVSIWQLVMWAQQGIAIGLSPGASCAPRLSCVGRLLHRSA